MGSNSLEELSHIGFLPFDPAALETAIGEISDLTVEYNYCVTPTKLDELNNK